MSPGSLSISVNLVPSSRYCLHSLSNLHVIKSIKNYFIVNSIISQILVKKKENKHRVEHFKTKRNITMEFFHYITLLLDLRFFPLTFASGPLSDSLTFIGILSVCDIFNFRRTHFRLLFRHMYTSLQLYPPKLIIFLFMVRELANNKKPFFVVTRTSWVVKFMTWKQVV